MAYLFPLIVWQLPTQPVLIITHILFNLEDWSRPCGCRLESNDHNIPTFRVHDNWRLIWRSLLAQSARDVEPCERPPCSCSRNCARVEVILPSSKNTTKVVIDNFSMTILLYKNDKKYKRTKTVWLFSLVKN